jgi:acetolactate synthase regulatory subunit
MIVPGSPAFAYPVLTACIAQDRAPRPGEVEQVARRVRREGFAATAVRDDAAAQRLAIRIARIALLGSRPRRAPTDAMGE